VVASGQYEFEGRYIREYLSGEAFRGFDEALVRLMDLLELPGVGKVVSGTLWVLRTPYRLVKGFLGKAMSRPQAGTRPEQPILEEALSGWIDLLRKEAARHAGEHPLWAHVARGFQDGGLTERVREQFQQSYRTFQTSLAVEVDRTARSIYEELEKRPGVLNTLRGSKFALDAGAIGVTIASLGMTHVALDFVMVPLVASITHQLVELMGKGYVDTHREQTRQRQQLLEVQCLSGPLAEFLIHWPSTGGSSFERLQLALRRIPPAIQQLNGLVQTAVRPA